MDTIDRFRGCLLGLAGGDAVGTTVEFRERGSFAPVTDMVGGGPFNLEPGEWTDDTSMALCLAMSLVKCRGFDPADQLERYCRWWETGYFSSTGRCFDIGGTTRRALLRFRKTNEPFCGPTNEHSAGNGCLMRLAPVPMFFFADREAAVRMSGESARTTHGAAECVAASRLLGAIIHRALTGGTRDEILLGHGGDGGGHPRLDGITRGEYQRKPVTIQALAGLTLIPSLLPRGGEG